MQVQNSTQTKWVWLVSICTSCICLNFFAPWRLNPNPQPRSSVPNHQHTADHLTHTSIQYQKQTPQCSRGILHSYLTSTHIAHTNLNTPQQRLSAKDHRPSYPFISGDAFRAMCQLRCEDSTSDRVCMFSATDVTPGACVYVATTDLQTSKTTDVYLRAFAHIAPHVQHDFVVITHNGDLSTPDGDDWHVHEGAVWSVSFSFLLQLPRLVAWFASNCNVNQSTPGADKVHCIPIGIENRYNKIGKNPERYHEALCRANSVEKTETLLVAFSAHRWKPWRDTALAGLLPRWKQTHFSTWEAWASAVHRHKFVACPVGHGYDTHRTWEVLLAGSVPLVDSTPMDAMYTGLPVVIVKNWTLVTEAYLLNAYDELCARRDYTPSKMFFSYWHDLIASIAHTTRADKTTPGSLQDTLAKMPPGDILFSYGNRDYLLFHLHWLCNTAAWEGVHARTLLVVDDEYSKAAICKLSTNVHVHILPSMHHHKGFYSKGYRKLTIQRVEILVELLRSGRGVVMFEGDAVWARNILTDPNLTATRREHDVAFYRDGVGGWMIGAGMMGMKGGRGPALRMWERVLAQLSTDMQPYEHLPDSTVISKTTAKHEQDILREDVIPSMLESGELKSIDLDRCLYVSGLWYRDPAEHRARCGGTVPYVLNNNYIIGNARKQERAQKHGHWFLRGSQCKDTKSKLAKIVASFAPNKHDITPLGAQNR